jgi:hypothetical protein
MDDAKWHLTMLAVTGSGGTMRQPKMIAYLALAIVALFAGFTIYTRLHQGCHFQGGRRGGWNCASSAPVAPWSRP